MKPNKIADGFIDEAVLDSRLENSKALMEEDLSKSGLDANDIYAEPRSLASLWCPRGDLVLGCYRIPYFNQEGQVLEHMWRERVFYKPGAPKDLPKYVQPNGEFLAQHDTPRCMPYLYPHGRSDEYVFITEGEKKAVKCSDEFDIRCIGIGGKDMWHSPDVEPKILHPEIVTALDKTAAHTIIVVADPDINEKEQVKRSYGGLLLRLRTQYADRTVRIIAPPEKVDDWLAANDVTLEEFLELEDIEGMETALPLSDLVRQYDLIAHTKTLRDGTQAVIGLVGNEYNVTALLEKHPMYKDSLRMNEDTQKLEVFGQPITNNLQDTSILCTFQRTLHMPKLSLRICQSAIKHVAAKHSYSPAVDDITACVEAAKHQDTDWFRTLFDDDLAPIIRALVCGYVKRVMNPGCDWRIMVILAGPQRVGKTGCARWVTGSKDRVYDFHSGQLDGKDKDTMKRLMRPGIALFDDIDTFGRVEKGRLKAIVTQQHTTLRGAYKEHDETHLRRGVMMGTTNDPLIIPDDPTGNTRFAVGEVRELLPFEDMIKVRAEVIAQAWDLVRDGYDGSDLNFAEMTERYTEKSSITEALEEFVLDIREGEIKPNGVDVWSNTEGWYFKSARFWQHVTGRVDYRPRDYERKELGLRARGLGLVWRDDMNKVRVGDLRVKNVWWIKR